MSHFNFIFTKNLNLFSGYLIEVKSGEDLMINLYSSIH